MNYLYETHMHTTESSFCSITKAKEHVRIYKDHGYTGIIITDHLKTNNFKKSSFKHLKPLRTWEEKVRFLIEGYKNAKKEGDKIGLDVFLGWEFYAGGSEFLTYGLDEEFLLKYKDLDKLSIEEYSRIVRENGGYLAQAHPYRAKRGMMIPVDPKLIDGIEIYNASRRYKENENIKAILFAKEHNLAVQAGTDAHHPELKVYSGIKMEQRAESIFDIINAIKAKKVKPILQPLETSLWMGPVEDLRKYVVLPKVSEFLVKIFYDCKHAKEVAEELRDFIEEHTEYESVCEHIDQFGKVENTGKVIKTILIGHHSKVDAMKERMKALQFQEYGVAFGFDNEACVITAKKSKLNKHKADKNLFFMEYKKRFDEDPENLYIREAQFRYAVFEFEHNGLHDFLK